MKNMWDKRYIFPIFFLYMITSMIFLTTFAYFYYIEQKHHILKSSIYQIKEISKDIQAYLRFDEDDLQSINTGNVKVKIYDNVNQKWLVKEFDEEDIFKSKKRLNSYAFKNNKLYYKEFFKFKRASKAYTLYFEDASYYENLRFLVIRLIFMVAISLAFFLIIAYFIIKLSLRPLFDKINELNSFITDTTHEIKTPLSVILMSLEMVDKNPKKYLENIKVATKTISNLYDDLVSLNLKSENNRLIMLDITNLVNQKVSYFEDIASKKGLKFRLNLSSLSLNTDPIKLSKILDNLISNAIKYSDENGEIYIFLDENSFSIENTGATIETKNLNKIFDKFSRFNSQNGGFGIGLSLVKKYSNELNYKIYCQSRDKKTKFTLKF
ncbi:sensor histidine kinase [Campylobacter corcagiensis]|uniref:histidine kinase n=1 Tax=Campylobacter corcagiensis TaxID=1448857 RepID=A0A7M1LEN3_9BACT|nr:HAMP domain-containing sensor histidine kinase [Campylobacter corcagiensis]QKF64830.1 two-component system sensor histidine kinase [Campylobacter corcagiensis]QOQ87008.1 HAMP domain-containing histidine kinase [Campylobacter corcagiensis]